MFHQIFIDFFRFWITFDAWRRNISKTMFIVDISRTRLKACGQTADMGVPLTDDPCRIPFKSQIHIRELKCSPMSALKTVNASEIILLIITGICSPADTSLYTNHRDWLFVCIILNNYFSHSLLNLRKVLGNCYNTNRYSRNSCCTVQDKRRYLVPHQTGIRLTVHSKHVRHLKGGLLLQRRVQTESGF